VDALDDDVLDAWLDEDEIDASALWALASMGGVLR
jgi:hypothetical protein